MTATITRAAYAAAVEAGQRKASPYQNRDSYLVTAADIVEAAFAAAGLTVRDPDPAPPAVVRISRERYEALVAYLSPRLNAQNMADVTVAAALCAAGIEPERTAEERLAEIEARVAAFLERTRCWREGDPSHWMTHVINEHLRRGLSDGR